MRIINVHKIDHPEAMFSDPIGTQTVEEDRIERVIDVSDRNCLAILNTYGVRATLQLHGEEGQIEYFALAAGEDNGTEILIDAGDGVPLGWTTGTGWSVGSVQTVSLLRDSIKDWWDWWFAPSRPGRDVIFYFPLAEQGQLATLTIEHEGFEAKCGLCVTGVFREAGYTLEAEVGIDDYSRVAIDEFGDEFLKQGRWAKRASGDIWCPTELFRGVERDIVGFRGKAYLIDYNEYIVQPSEYHTLQNGHQSLIVYGVTEEYNATIDDGGGVKIRHESRGVI